MVKKKKQGEASQFELKREASYRYTSNRYKQFVKLMAVLFALVFVVGIVFQPRVKVSEYTLDKWIASDKTNFKIIEKAMNPEETALHLKMVVDADSLLKAPIQSVKIQPELKRGDVSDVSLNIYHYSNTFYEVVVTNLPKKWGAIRLKVTTDLSETPAYFIFNQIPVNGDFDTLVEGYLVSNELAYLREIRYQQSLVLAQKEEVKAAEVVESETQIEQLYQQIETLKQEKNYQTEAQQQATNSQILTLEHQVTTLKNAIVRIQSEQLELAKQYQLLEEKIQHFANKFGINLSDI